MHYRRTDHRRHPNRLLYVLSCLMLVLSAAARGADAVLPAPGADQSTSAPMQAPPLDQLAERLALRLEKQPDDVDGWVLLGRSYHHLGRFEEAKLAFEHARQLGYSGETIPPPRRGAVDPLIMRDIRDTVH